MLALAPIILNCHPTGAHQIPHRLMRLVGNPYRRQPLPQPFVEVLSSEVAVNIAISPSIRSISANDGCRGRSSKLIIPNSRHPAVRKFAVFSAREP